MHVLYDGLDEVGHVCDACVSGGPEEMSRQAMRAADELYEEVKRGWFLGKRLASGVKRLDGTGVYRDEDAERDGLRTKLANCYHTVKQASK